MKVKSCSDAEAQRTQLNLPKSNYSSDWVNVKRSAVNAVRLGVSHIRVSDVKSWITNCGARLIQIPSQQATEMFDSRRSDNTWSTKPDATWGNHLTRGL